jgi:hypothetical protein
MKKSFDEVLRVSEIQDYKKSEMYGAPMGLRGFIKKSNIEKVENIKDVGRVHKFPTLSQILRNQKKKLESNLYWALIQVETSTEGLKSKYYHYFSIALEAVDGWEADRLAKEIAKQYNVTNLNLDFRKEKSKSKLLLVEGCETERDKEKPFHWVLMRTGQSSKKKLDIDKIVKDHVPLY